MESQQEKLRNVESACASTAADRIPDDIPSITDRAKSDIAEAAETAKAEARRIVSRQKDVGADRLGEVAGAVHGAARSLESGMPQMASYVHNAAVRLEDAAKTLRQRNIDDLVAEVSRFARSQPALFVGGAMLAGFALTRFLKSSGPGGATRSGVVPGTGSGWRQAEAEGPR